MFTFAAATAEATFAVNPMLSGNVAVISFAARATNSGAVRFLAAAGAFTAFLVDAFRVAFFVALAMVSEVSFHEFPPSGDGR
jgi:basic membrane lipoprotein Med (substrate-binding protein (PBP1-ABC) superfamily)